MRERSGLTTSVFEADGLIMRHVPAALIAQGPLYRSGLENPLRL